MASSPPLGRRRGGDLVGADEHRWRLGRITDAAAAGGGIAASSSDRSAQSDRSSEVATQRRRRTFADREGELLKLFFEIPKTRQVT